MRPLTVLLLFVVVFLPTRALAHHGWSQYDRDQTITISGPIAEVEYVNPHVSIKIESDGKTWVVVMAPIYGMQSRGLPSGSLRPGMEVTVVGHPHRTNPDEMRAESITVEGKTVEFR
jgi:hypothetical protein